MNRIWKNISISIAAVFLTISAMTGCGNGGPSSSVSSVFSASGAAAVKPDPVVLNFYIFGNEANRMQDICDEFYKRTRDTLDTKLVFYFLPGWDDYTNKINVAFAAGEQIDALFDAPWYDMGTRISKNMYLDLDPYFNNNEYPGLKKSFSKDYISSNKFMDPENEMHVYGIPLMQAPADPKGVVYRLDLAKKYGIDKINSFDDLYKFYNAILANEKGMIPMAASNGWGYMFTSTVNPVMAPKISQWYDQYVILNPDGKTAKAIVSGFTPEQAKFYGIPSYYNNIPALEREWYVKGYVAKDVVNEKDEIGLFKAGKAASEFTDCTNAYSILSSIRSFAPQADLGIFVLNPDIAAMKPRAIVTDYKAWNFMCIPSNSKNADRTMKVFDWIFSSQANNDLFQFGIEGRDFIPAGNDKYRIPDGVDASSVYNLPNYDLTMNPNFVRMPVDFPEQLMPLKKYLLQGSTYVKSVVSGFSFNQAPVKDLIVAISTVKDEDMITNGMVENWQEVSKTAQEKKKELGYDKVLAEELKQYNEYAAKLK